jgi:beta-galactosidase
VLGRDRWPSCFLATSVCVFIISSTAAFSAQLSSIIKLNAPLLYLGTAWYPEQWPQARWEVDLSLMQQAGIRFVRVGEFSWSTSEPKEGYFNFVWLDRAIQLAAEHGLYTVLATPTAAPPAPGALDGFLNALAILETIRRNM